MSETTSTETWSEDDSQHFIDYGAYFVPERELQIDTICSVIPPVPRNGHIVEICSGEGLLAEALAKRFPACMLHALDGSRKMLESTAAKIAATGCQYDTRLMDIAKTDWRKFDYPVHAFVSSLAIHHLDGPGKAELFKTLAQSLAPGGVVVVCDLVEARTPENLALWVRHWDEGVRTRALELDGNENMLEFFRADGWNYYAEPDADPVDQPSGLLEQLSWMADAGLERIDVHWLKAGHAIFSGRKSEARTGT